MGTVRVVYKKDKTVSIIYPMGRKENETKEDWLNRAFEKTMRSVYDEKGKQTNPLHGLEFDDIDSSELPQDRVERNKWEGEKGKKIKVNLNK